MEAEQKCFEHLVAWEIVSTEQTADRIIYPTGHELFIVHGAAKVRCKCCGRIELAKQDTPFVFPPSPDGLRRTSPPRTGISVIRGFFQKVFHV